MFVAQKRIHPEINGTATRGKGNAPEAWGTVGDYKTIVGDHEPILLEYRKRKTQSKNARGA